MSSVMEESVEHHVAGHGGWQLLEELASTENARLCSMREDNEYAIYNLNMADDWVTELPQMRRVGLIIRV